MSRDGYAVSREGYAVLRDLDTVTAGLQAWLTACEPGVEIEVLGAERPSVGFSGETILVDVRRAGANERLVLKLPPAGAGIAMTYDFVLQAGVQTAVAALGVPAPVPARAETDPRWLGAPFLVMPAVAGYIIDEVPARDRWLATATPEMNAQVHGRYVDLLAEVHAIDWRRTELDQIVPVRDNLGEIAHWRRYLSWFADGEVLVPALVDALDWCEAHRPDSEAPPSLLWGDVRLGNVIFDDARTPVAVLDWEMASIGAGEHDLAWTLTLQSIQDELFRRPVPGFLDRAAVVSRYESAVGRPVRDLQWYETLAIVRSTAMMARVGLLQERAGERSYFPIANNPILDILQRRIGESTADAFHLG